MSKRHSTAGKLTLGSVGVLDLKKLEQKVLLQKHGGRNGQPERTLFGDMNPREALPTKEGNLSARQISHRSRDFFVSNIKTSAFVLKNDSSGNISEGKSLLFTYFSRAYSFQRIGELKKAKECYTKCIEYNPAWALAYYNRASVCHAMENVQQAISDINEAIKYDPRNMDYLRSRAMIYREMGRYREATRDYNRVHNMRSTYGEGMYAISQTITDPPEDVFVFNELRKDPIARRPEILHRVQQIVMKWKYFSNLQQHSTVELLKNARLVEFKVGDYVFIQGEAAATFFIIMKGSASICIEERDFNDNVIKSTNVKDLYKGDTFGEPSALGEKLRAASVKCAVNLLCLVVDYSIYQKILGYHEGTLLQEKIEFLGRCRLFSAPFLNKEATMAKIAKLAMKRVYEPGRVLLQEGQIVKNLYIIRKGVCRVVKRIPRPNARKFAVANAYERSTKRIDRSWVVDNSWQLTNPRLQQDLGRNLTIDEIEAAGDEIVTAAILVSGQMFGETCVLHPDMLSPVTVYSTTLTEIYELSREDISALNVKFNVSSKTALQESFVFHNPPVAKLVQMRREKNLWDREKSKIVSDALLNKSSSLPKLSKLRKKY